MELDKQQKAAVQTDAPKVIVAASAGSGKTRVITERIKFLLTNGYESKNIYAITYTNAAAQEMKKRIGGDTNCFIGTIHSLANRILLQNGIDTSWMIQTENFDLLFEKIQDKIGEIHFPQIDYLLIDEFQDICDNEYEFIFDVLAPNQFMAVGDSAQAIYSFKGGNFQHFMDLINREDITVFELNNCYRCGMDIIDFAETFLYPVYDIYKVPAECASGKFGNVKSIPFSWDNLIAEVEDDDFNYRDIFILVRTNAEIAQIKELFDKSNIPCDTFKKSDLDSDGLKDILNKNTVKVLTAHSAKGLEARKVIVISFNLYNNEERRLAYVAATRAEDELIWFTQKKKMRRGKRKKINTQPELLEW